MKITLITPRCSEEDLIQEATRPYQDAMFVRVPTCPICKREPADVQGKNPRWLDEETCESDATCLDCQKPVGTLRVVLGTLFGLEEDERVLNSGRWRVY